MLILYTAPLSQSLPNFSEAATKDLPLIRFLLQSVHNLYKRSSIAAYRAQKQRAV
jgi:hypothetical protein